MALRPHSFRAPSVSPASALGTPSRPRLDYQRLSTRSVVTPQSIDDQQRLESGLLMCLRCSFNEGLFLAGTCMLIVVGFVTSGRILDLLVVALFVLLLYAFLRFILLLIFMALTEGCPAVQQILLDHWYCLMNPFRQLIGLPPLEHQIQEEPLPQQVSSSIQQPQSHLLPRRSPPPSSSPRRRAFVQARSSPLSSSSLSSPPPSSPPRLTPSPPPPPPRVLPLQPLAEEEEQPLKEPSESTLLVHIRAEEEA
ncbi:hypothetical protein K1719_004684 [Acacia pycnantha]|nr:hypothetical protein K1719_004684 [Acacia pycnantha]